MQHSAWQTAMPHFTEGLTADMQLLPWYLRKKSTLSMTWEELHCRRLPNLCLKYIHLKAMHFTAAGQTSSTSGYHLLVGTPSLVKATPSPFGLLTPCPDLSRI